VEGRITRNKGKGFWKTEHAVCLILGPSSCLLTSATCISAVAEPTLRRQRHSIKGACSGKKKRKNKNKNKKLLWETETCHVFVGLKFKRDLSPITSFIEVCPAYVSVSILGRDLDAHAATVNG
jgi:hypothetical protein